MLTQVAEVELVYRSKVRASQRSQVNSAQEAYELLISVWDDGKLDQLEQFEVPCLYNVSSGGVTGTVANPRLLFTAALRMNAVALILVQNHPSGSLKP